MAQTIPLDISSTDPVPFSTIIVLDGNSYIFYAFWNLFAQRWYLTLSDQNGQIVLHTPIIGCISTGIQIDLTYGLFASTLVYQSDTGNLVAIP